MDDKKTCEELLCPVLEAPFYGVVSPSTCVKRFENIQIGSVCKYECSKGYELISNTNKNMLTCRIDGTWSSDTPSCHPVKCPVLSRPSNGGLIPARCHDDGSGFNEFGQRCVAYCKHGYRLRGPPTKYCQADKKWSMESAMVECIKVIEPPYLNCPNDVDVTLPSHQSWLTLGNLWQEPQTNINRSNIVIRPNNYGPSYNFTHGKTLISYQAKHETGEVLYCSYMIHVADKTPPQTSGCPSDIAKISNNDRTIISWSVPTFTDNVAIRDIITPNRNPGDIWHSGESMILMYLATDTSGNSQKCVFKVSYKSTTCSVLTGNDMTTVNAYTPQRRYGVSCKGHRTLFGNYGFQGSVAYCKDGDYYIEQENIGLKTPECVGYNISTKTSSCNEGSVKFSYDDWFTGTKYYCAYCPTGKYYSNSTCITCGKGSYQDEQGQSYCEACPVGYFTERNGAKDITECLEYCQPGYYSPSGFNALNQPCKPCPKGSYAYLNGTTECTACPNDATTLLTGSTDEDDCQVQLSIDRVEPGERVTSLEFNNVRFECFYSGLPTPSATWLKVNGPMPPITQLEEIYNTNFEQVGVALTLHKVQLNSGGTYRCAISNNVNRLQKDVYLTVKPAYG